MTYIGAVVLFSSMGESISRYNIQVLMVAQSFSKYARMHYVTKNRSILYTFIALNDLAAVAFVAEVAAIPSTLSLSFIF